MRVDRKLVDNVAVFHLFFMKAFKTNTLNDLCTNMHFY